LVYSHIVDLKLVVWPVSCDVCRDRLAVSTKEISADSKVDEEEERLVEGLSVLGVLVCAGIVEHLLKGDSRPDLTVQRELYALVGPDGTIRVEVFGEIGSNCSAVTLVTIVGPGTAKMKSGRVLSVLTSAVLHNVDLSGCGPAPVDVVAGKHPQRGPQIQTLWEPRSGFELSILPCERMLRVDATRGVLFVVASVLDLCCDEEGAVADSYVLLAGGVALVLVVLWAACDFMLPLGPVEGVAIELI